MLEILENAIPHQLFADLKKEISLLPWFFIENTAYFNNSGNPFDFSWQHIAIINANANSYFADFTRKIVESVLKNNNIKYKNILKARFGLITALPIRHMHSPHVDLIEPHHVGLIYLNNADGDTYFFDACYDYRSNLSSLDYLNNFYSNNLPIKTTISPVENKMVLFNGSIFHASSTPLRVSHRITLNFCFNT